MDRALGVGEKFWHMASLAAAGNGVLRARVRGPLEPGLLRVALDAVQRRHPLLGVHVESAPGGPRFVSQGTGPIPLTVETITGEDGWLPVAERETARRFGPDEPLARAILAHDDVPGEVELLMVVDHLVIDGMSGATLLGDVLHGIVAAAEGRTPEDERLPERPAADDLLPDEYRGAKGMRSLAAWMGRTAASSRSRPAQLRPDADVPPSEQVSRLLQRSLDEETTSALLAGCAAHGTTLIGLMTATTLGAVAADVAERGGPAAPTIACQSTVDVRRMLRPRVSRREVGLFASGVVTAHKVTPEGDTWALARRASGMYRDAVFRGEHFVGIPLGKAFQRGLDRRGGDVPARYMKFMRRMSPAAFAISVMSGQSLELERVGDFELVDLAALTGLSWLGPLLVGANHIDGRMRLGLMYAEPVLARERVELLADRMIRTLRTAAEVAEPAVAA